MQMHTKGFKKSQVGNTQQVLLLTQMPSHASVQRQELAKYMH